MTEPEHTDPKLEALKKIDEEMADFPQGWVERQRPQREENPDGIDRTTNP